MDLTPEELDFLGAPKPTAFAHDGPGWVDTKCEAGHPVGKRPPGSMVASAACETCKLVPATVPADMPLPDPLERVPDGWTYAACPDCGHEFGKRPPGHVIDPRVCPNYPHAPAEPVLPKKERKPRAKKALSPEESDPIATALDSLTVALRDLTVAVAKFRG